MKEKILPSVVLTLIAVVICGLLVLANYLTKDKIAAAEEEKIKSSLSSTFGDADYKEIDGALKDKIISGHESVNNVYSGDNGKTIFEITETGYAKDGIHVLIGFDQNGSIDGISFLGLKETPGLGTKIEKEPGFTEQFKGQNEKKDEFTKITGATKSSKGMKKAVDTAFDCYRQYTEGGSVNE